MINGAWRRVSDELGRILELPEADRATALLRLAEEDPELASEVEELLAYEAVGAEAGESALALERIGEYKLIEEIGRGGTSVVYSARKNGLDRVVALKLILSRPEATTQGGAYRREQAALARLRHPSIVTLLDGGLTDGGLPYLVLERVQGVRIDEYCRTACRSAQDVALVFLKLVEALAAAHAIGIVHRDLKPSNVLVEPSGLPRLLDFGLAKVPKMQFTATSVGMTLAFASPEQIQGHTTTSASDVYSLGVMLFGLLTQRSPYGEDQSNLLRFMETVCEREIAPPERYAFPGAAAKPDAALNRILDRCVRKSERDRYPAANELAEDLRRWLRDGSSYPGFHFRLPWRLRLSGPVLLTAGLLLTAVVGWGIRTESAKRAQATESHRQTMERLVQAVMAVIDEDSDGPAAMRPTRRALLQETMASLRALEQGGGSDNMQYQLGVVHEQMSRRAGSTDEGIRETLEAQRYYFRLHERAPEKPAYRVALARNYVRMAELYEAAKDYSGRSSALQEARRYARTLAGDSTAEPLVQLIERREAAATLWTSREHMRGDRWRDDLMIAMDVGGVAEAERRNGLLPDAERSYRAAREALAKADRAAAQGLDPSWNLEARIKKLRELAMGISQRKMQSGGLESGQQ